MSLSYDHSLNGSTDVVKVSGRLISKIDSEGLTGKINDLLAEERSTILLELSELEYMNSTGLNILLSLFTATRNAGGDLYICNVSTKVEELLVMTKLNSVFRIFKTMEEALAAFSE